MKINTKVTISRNNQDEIILSIKDCHSRARFVSVTLTLEQYALIITGLSDVECVANVDKLDVVGKEKVNEDREAYAPHLGYSKGAYEQWLIDNAQEEGWILSYTLNSQSSIKYLTDNESKDSKVRLKYGVYKYV